MKKIFLLAVVALACAFSSVTVQAAPQPDETVYTVVETMPAFPGGEAEFMKFLQENCKYPEECKSLDIAKAKPICRFVVNQDGSISDIQVMRNGGHEAFGKELERVLKLMPKWTPGKQGGKPVRTYRMVAREFVKK